MTIFNAIPMSFDAILRDGDRPPGFVLTPNEKIRIAPLDHVRPTARAFIRQTCEAA